jgi:Mg-chelatase subunit ChlI
MKDKEKKTGSVAGPAGGSKKPHPDGYPLYPVNEDIYNKFSGREDIDPEDITRKKDAAAPVRPVSKHAARADEASPGSDLDIPGAEADDEQEATGSEDEENNYYSLGGDEHNDLEEDNQ